jgi:hypothetical protein
VLGVFGTRGVGVYVGEGVCCVLSNTCANCCNSKDENTVFCSLSFAISASSALSLSRFSRPHLSFTIGTSCISSMSSSHVL